MVAVCISYAFNFRLCTCGSAGKESTCNAGVLGSIPGLGRSSGEGNGNPLEYSCLENPMDRGGWWATVHGVARVRCDVATTAPPPPLLICILAQSDQSKVWEKSLSLSLSLTSSPVCQALLCQWSTLSWVIFFSLHSLLGFWVYYVKKAHRFSVQCLLYKSCSVNTVTTVSTCLVYPQISLSWVTGLLDRSDYRCHRH